MANTKIEWTDYSWNPIDGCTPVSEECTNCYASRHAKRFWGDRKFSDIRFHPERIGQPLEWDTPRRIFVCSMADLFHPAVLPDWLNKVVAVTTMCQQHTLCILTKYPQRMAEYIDYACYSEQGNEDIGEARADLSEDIDPCDFDPTLPNIWLGISCGLAKYTSRIDLLRQTPAKVRFLSLEPLLGPIPNLNLDGIHWVICGGESGPGARPMKIDWVRSIRDQCVEAGVPFFFKQWGGVNKKKAGRLLDGRNWNEYPKGR